MYFLSVIIPVYNEEKIIAETIRKVTDYFKRKEFSWEIILIDDGSHDDSRRIIQNFSHVKLLINEKNQGKGWAVKKGMLNSQGEWMLFLDADLSTDIIEFDKFEPFMKEFEVIIGTRQSADTKITKSQPFYRVYLGRLGNLIIRNFLGFRFKDTQCGFKLFNQKCRMLFRNQLLKRWGFDFEIILLAQKYAFKVKEVGIDWHDSMHSNVKAGSYLNTLIELLKIKLNIIRKRYD